MKRRDFISKAGVGVVAGVAGASALSAPAVAGGHKAVSYTHLTLPTILPV